MVRKKMKHDLTTGTWQDDTGCPISIILVSTSDGTVGNGGLRTCQQESPWGAPPASFRIGLRKALRERMKADLSLGLPGPG
jgi:hypothetical protein